MKLCTFETGATPSAERTVFQSQKIPNEKSSKFGAAPAWITAGKHYDWMDCQGPFEETAYKQEVGE